MTVGELQTEYAKRGYGLTLRGNVWYITKKGRESLKSKRFPGTAITPVLKKFAREAVNNIDGTIKEFDSGLKQVVTEDVFAT